MAGKEVPPIFLSHSGKQKAFVEHLYDALQRADQNSFFDKHSLPKGQPFPSNIEEAARGCKLGVVVLSEDFLTSKWPMRELEMLVLARPSASVLPLFYKLHPCDLKAPKNLAKWRCVWEEKAGADDADKWEQAVKALARISGELYIEGTSEVAYIKVVVRHICTLVPNRVLYDVSLIQGHDRLAKETARRFEQARMVGLHGVAGLGKTTLCQIMTNFYNVDYIGRSCLIEFPTPTDGQEKLMIDCKKALKKLVSLNEQVLNEVDSFDQVVQLMKGHVGRHDVFLAIDNVSESCSEAVERILDVSFSANSKILVTSRSEQVLKDLLLGRNNASLSPLPAPEHKEAFEIFQETSKLGDLNSLLVCRDQIDSVLKRCRFSGNYHPLALKELGQYVRRNFDPRLSLILKEISNANLKNLDDKIRRSYTSLQEEDKQHMFLDIAVLLKLILDEVTCAKAQECLRFLYKEFPETMITSLIYELALDGVIQIEEEGGSAKKIIRVNDLFVAFAWTEAARSSRFFTKGSKGIECGGLERVILTQCDNPDHLEQLQQQECPKLQALYAVGIKFGRRIHVGFMPSLSVLILKDVLEEIVGLDSLKNLKMVQVNGGVPTNC